MEIAELIIFFVLCFVIYKAFTPLQRHLEIFLLRWFRKSSKGQPRSVIDITEYSKNSKTKKDPEK